VTLSVGDKLSEGGRLCSANAASRQLPICDDGQASPGSSPSRTLLRVLRRRRASTTDSVLAEVMERRVAHAREHASASELPRLFERGEVAIVVDEEHKHVTGLLTKLDLIDFLTKQAQEQPAGA
jgi:CBS-domain-containing membrane protein